MKNENRKNNSVVRRIFNAIMFRFGYVPSSELTALKEEYEKQISSLTKEVERLTKEVERLTKSLEFYKGEYEAAWALLVEMGMEPKVKEQKKDSKKSRKSSDCQTHRGPYDKTNKTLTPRQVEGHTRTYKSGKVVEVKPFERGSWITNDKLAG